MPSQNVIPISGIEDPRLAPYRNLRNRNPAVEGDTFIAEGRLVVDRLIDSDYAIESLLLEAGKENEFVSRVDHNVPIYCLPPAEIKELVGFDFHRGVIASGRRKAPASAGALTFPDGAVRVALAVIDVEDQENMGSIMRSAAALGIHQILLGPNTIDPFRRRVIRVSMANVLGLRFYRMSDPSTELAMLRSQAGFRMVASTLSDAIEPGHMQRDGRPIILMVGNEARGLDQELQRLADDRVRIPMEAGCDSLNVAVAAAILMYELTRRS